MIAAARKHEEAFHCLMEEYFNPKKYPIFKAFYAQCKKEAILQVYYLMLAMKISNNSW